MTSPRLDQVVAPRTLAPNALWATVRVGDEHLVFPTAGIIEMVPVPVASQLPHAPPAVRGVAMMRGQTVLVVDMRQRLGLPTAIEEQETLAQLLAAREQDHKEWLNDLEASVRDARPFTRTLDPHACAFGKWYDTYQAPTLEIEGFMRLFDEPHQAIHAVGGTAISLVHAGKVDEAHALIAASRTTTLTRLVELFEGAQRLVRSAAREIAVISTTEGRPIGLVVDEVVGIDQLKPDSLVQLPRLCASRDPAILGTARTLRDDRVVVVLDLPTLTRAYVDVAA
jgi:chemotaxis signal transduction protein